MNLTQNNFNSATGNREFEDNTVRNQHVREFENQYSHNEASRKKSIKQILMGVLFVVILSLVDFLMKKFEPQGALKVVLVISFIISAGGSLQICYGAYGFINSLFAKNK